MPTDLPAWHFKLLRALASDEGEGLTTWFLGSTLTISGMPSASASGRARYALERLCRLRLVSKEVRRPVSIYRITTAGRNTLADRTVPDHRNSS